MTPRLIIRYIYLLSTVLVNSSIKIFLEIRKYLVSEIFNFSAGTREYLLTVSW